MREELIELEQRGRLERLLRFACAPRSRWSRWIGETLLRRIYCERVLIEALAARLINVPRYLVHHGADPYMPVAAFDGFCALEAAIFLALDDDTCLLLVKAHREHASARVDESFANAFLHDRQALLRPLIGVGARVSVLGRLEKIDFVRRPGATLRAAVELGASLPAEIEEMLARGDALGDDRPASPTSQ